ncbi:MAG: peptide-methionine (S)-S-oxide reductase MsrA [Actinomycetota bacterium]|jgi:methionine-S-sulfoxide reductase|nr:peptide-methionine (S)-S-oxide reductase MsrA [Actinomycetota bacterium]MDA3008580.1 peptide-methionine (S)-S-oxide reductase MsrA [Actinomycetota bacterium]MDA3037604.1 peptide-methionine (S)-S-oxide reductase MsrA [Actinomycetota bacterium]
MKTLKVLVLLLFVSCSSIESVKIMNNNYEKAYFAGGCFWCMEPPFEALEGVIEATSGYMGGTVENPTYEEVTTGNTGHAEVVEILFDPKVVSYEELLEVFWRNIDPTALNYQFADVGSQYRTEIFTINPKQKQLAEESKNKLEKSGKFNKPIVTAISEAPIFYIAEEYHQDFYKKQAMRYEMYAQASGRKGYIKKTWGND